MAQASHWGDLSGVMEDMTLAVEEALGQALGGENRALRWMARPLVRGIARRAVGEVGKLATSRIDWAAFDGLEATAEKISAGVMAAVGMLSAEVGAMREEAREAGVEEGMTVGEAWEWLRFRPMPALARQAMAALREGEDDDRSPDGPE